jgi:hypothetical protein
MQGTYARFGHLLKHRHSPLLGNVEVLVLLVWFLEEPRLVLEHKQMLGPGTFLV